jgi:LmbE family N-acetylglucosaminyl deacetylase
MQSLDAGGGRLHPGELRERVPRQLTTQPRRFVSLVAASLVAACHPRAPESIAADWLIVAPHPDDEVLMAGALMARARGRGESVVVAIMTNGDARCAVSGYVRERESLAALAKVGVPQENVFFLGYPDGALEALGTVALAPAKRIDAAGACIEATGTYASDSDHIRSVSMQRMGMESPYRLHAALEDLAWLFERFRPRRVVTAHPADDHPDHATTGLDVYRALEKTRIAPPEVLFSIVHAGPHWPTVNGAGRPRGSAKPREPMPPLPGGLAPYAPNLRVSWASDAVPSMADLVATYASQLGADPSTNWLQSFVRADDVFFRSPFRCDGTPRLCDDGRIPWNPRVIADDASPWPAAFSIPIRASVGLRIETADPTSSFRVCVRPMARGGHEVLLHHFAPEELLERRFAGERQGDVRVAWVEEAPGVITLDFADDGGTFGRRLVPVAGPLRARPDASCADVP